MRRIKMLVALSVPVMILVLSIGIRASSAGYSFSNYLSVGSTGVDVSALQTWLIANGFSIPAISSGSVAKGRFGSQTRSAVIKYQASIGISATGFVGPLTIAALNKGAVASRSTSTIAVSCPAGFTCTPTISTAQPGSTSATTTGITTPGVAGTLNVSNAPEVANGASFYAGQTLNVTGFRYQTGPSDMEIIDDTTDFNVRPWLYFSGFTVVDQYGDTITPYTPISQSDFTEITPSEDYRYTQSGLNMVIPHDQTVDFILIAKANTNISQTPGTYVNIIGFTVRAKDGTGVVDTEAFPILPLPFTDASPYGSALYNGSLTALLIPSIDGTSPSAQIVQTQTGSVTNNVPLVIYDVQAQNNSATLQGLVLNIGVNGAPFGGIVPTPSSVFNTIQLQAGGQTYYGTITSGTPVGTYTPGTVTFSSNVNVPLPLGQTVQLKIIANVSQAVTGVTASTSLASSVAGTFTGVDANYNNPTVQNVGNIASAITTFSTTAAFSVVAGAPPTLTQVSYTGGATQGTYTAATWPFTFTVSSGSSPIYISANPGTAVKIGTDLTGATGPSGSGNASTTMPVGISSPNVTGDTNSGFGTSATGSYYVPSNSSRTFTLTVIQNNATNASTDGSAVVGLTGIYYGSSATAAGAIVGTTTAGATVAGIVTTGTQNLYTLPSSVNSPTVSLVTK